MAKIMSMVVLVFLLALILSTNPVKATDCLSVVSSIFSCRNYLENPIPISPGNQCCDAVRNIYLAENGDSLCKCLRQNSLGFGFIPSKARQLTGVCNLAGLAAPLVNCLVATSATESAKDITIPLPPLTPGLLPPISFPFPPLPPGLLPPISFPFPPLTPGLLPPLPPLTPGLLPPLPPLTPGLLPPLPPLTPGLLPPLPPFLPPLIPFPPLTPFLPPTPPAA